jgi:hypothetical protein
MPTLPPCSLTIHGAVHVQSFIIFNLLVVWVLLRFSPDPYHPDPAQRADPSEAERADTEDVAPEPSEPRRRLRMPRLSRRMLQVPPLVRGGSRAAGGAMGALT